MVAQAIDVGNSGSSMRAATAALVSTILSANRLAIMRYRAVPCWHYKTIEIESYQTGIRLAEPIHYPYIKITTDGVLHLHAGYAWNGVDVITPIFLASRKKLLPALYKKLLGASLPHDALCQLIQLGALDKTWREKADDLLLEIWLRDGVPAWLARIMTQCVRAFGSRYSKIGKVGDAPILEAP
jgi:hypothetical protein